MSLSTAIDNVLNYSRKKSVATGHRGDKSTMIVEEEKYSGRDNSYTIYERNGRQQVASCKAKTNLLMFQGAMDNL